VVGPTFVAGITPGDKKGTAPILQWMVDRGFSRPQIITHCRRMGWKWQRIDRRGARNPNAVLTPALVREVRRLNDLGFGYLWLARWVGVSKSCIQKVCNGKHWKRRDYWV
jgi:hypothetical protein